jgi:hypothetical protein
LITILIRDLMTILIKSGWENSAGMDVQDGGNIPAYVWTHTGDSVAVSNLQPHSGNYHLMLHGSGSGDEYAGLIAILPTPQSRVYARAYFMFKDSLPPPADQYMNILEFADPTDTQTLCRVCIIRRPDGTLQLEFVSKNGTVDEFRDVTFPFVLNQWYCIEMFMIVGTNGSYGVYIDGTLVAVANGVNSSAYGNVAYVRLETAGTMTVPHSVYVDDVAIADAAIGPEPPSTGTLAVTAIKNAASVAASVSVSGQTGVTPVSFTLTPGTYSVTATYAGASLTQSVTIVAGQTTSVTFDFSVSPGFITVNAFSDSTQIAANVTADGQAGITPVTFSFPPGTYNVSATYQGQTLPAQQVVVVAGQTSIINLYFVAPVTHSLIITTEKGGTTNPPPGTYDYNEGASAVVTAVPDVSYRFDHWELDGTVRTENPITVLMNRDYSLRAVFEYVPPPPTTGDIQGTVKDKAGTPLAGATVTCDGFADITEADGSFQFLSIEPKRYTVTASKEGYVSQAVIVVLQPGTTVTLEFTLTPPAPPTLNLLPLALLSGLVLIAPKR